VQEISTLDEGSFDYRELTELLQVHLEKESSDKAFIILDGVKVVL